MDKYKIVTYGTTVGREGKIEREVLEEGGYSDFELVHVPGNDDERFFEEAKDADGICAWLYLKGDDYDRLPKCKVIVAPAIGTDRFELSAATARGICVANIPDYCVEEVAMHTLALMMDCCRKITFFDRRVRHGEWEASSPWPIYRMKDRVYGLMSFGHIPQRVAEMIRPLGAKIMAYDPFVADEVFKYCGVTRAETVEELLSEANYISVHTPHLPATHHLIGKEQLDMLQDGAIIVVTGRGGVVDEEALKSALINGKVSCAGIDVIEDEINNGSVLRGMDNVIMTSHVGYYSEDASDDLKRKAMEQIVSVVREGKPPKNLLNKDVLGQARFE